MVDVFEDNNGTVKFIIDVLPPQKNKCTSVQSAKRLGLLSLEILQWLPWVTQGNCKRRFAIGTGPDTGRYIRWEKKWLHG